MRVNATTKTWDNILSRVKEMNQEELQQLKEEIQIRNQNGKGLPAYGNLDEITFHCGMILTLLGQDMEDENLKDTPRRMARYLFEFLNYDPGNYETTFEAIQTDQLVIVKEVPFLEPLFAPWPSVFGRSFSGLSDGFESDRIIKNSSNHPKACP